MLHLHNRALFLDLKVSQMHAVWILENPGHLPIQKRLQKVLHVNKKVWISSFVLSHQDHSYRKINTSPSSAKHLCIDLDVLMICEQAFS